MNQYEKSNKKEFCLQHYYNQIEKIQNSTSFSKNKTLSRDYSAGALPKDHKNQSSTLKCFKNSKNYDHQRLDLSKYTKKNFDKQRYNRVDQYKKTRQIQQKYNSNLYTHSLGNSSISGQKYEQQSNIQEKQNQIFSQSQQTQFINFCSDIYKLQKNQMTVEGLLEQINKRDEVYEVVNKHLKIQKNQQITQKFKKHMQEYRLMQKIICQFKALSKLQTQDLNELYYFLKDK